MSTRPSNHYRLGLKGFTNDKLIFCKATRQEALDLREVLYQYELISGQCINFEEYGLFFSPNTLINAGDNL